LRQEPGRTDYPKQLSVCSNKPSETPDWFQIANQRAAGSRLVQDSKIDPREAFPTAISILL
jgi:hypothetical protein